MAWGASVVTVAIRVWAGAARGSAVARHNQASDAVAKLVRALGIFGFPG